MATENNNDLVLAPGEYAYVLDSTKGLVSLMVGPYKGSMSTTDQPVVWDKQAMRFERVTSAKAIRVNTIAPEGFYVALLNPAVGDKLPREGAQASTELQVGHRVNIPGPTNFPLWPCQMADVIKGHHLRSNQYLLAQVYNDAEASKNWKDAVVRPASADAAPVSARPTTFAPGQSMIIKGTDVAFFIPPTGIKVVPECGNYVREAITLERLEYCILLDEDGRKRFVQGPNVVFPAPTETFVVKENNRKFKAIDLNETTGIYVKVIADYTDGDVMHKAGDELFITGKEQAIYYQREEHSVIRYGSGEGAQTKHYAVAVPSGEGRYVLDRTRGAVALKRGPAMLLCDPRYEVIVRRVLAEATAALWYPGNARVVQVNRELAQATAEADSSQYEAGRTTSGTMNYMTTANDVGSARSRQIAGDTFVRGSAFTPPRTITLDTKYEGAVSVTVWTGYAVLVVNKTGERRVVEGPNNVLLEYDETLAPLGLSTGRPKTNDELFKTVYLNVKNNVVSDVVDVETKDLVKASVTLAYRVNFEGDDKVKWFAAENYVRLLCDHLRSRIRNTVKRVGIEQFYGGPIDIIRDAVLGAAKEGGRPGLKFAENGMRLYDIEVLDVTITDKTVSGLLGLAELNALKAALQIAEAERSLGLAKRTAEVTREISEIKADTAKEVSDNSAREVAAALALTLAEQASVTQQVTAKLNARVAEQEQLNAINVAEIAREHAKDESALAKKTAEIDLTLKAMLAETAEIVKRAEAIDDKLVIALTAFADSALTEKIVTTMAPMAAMSGVSAAEILGKLFKGTPLAGVLDTLAARTRLETYVEAPKK